MTSLVSLVKSAGVLKRGDNEEDVKALQLALVQAGYRVNVDGDFGPGTESAVRRFQWDHHIDVDGQVGPQTAAMLDMPHELLVAAAKPSAIITPSGHVWPHDDTASLTAFYGKPWENQSLLTRVDPPWQMFYGDQKIEHIQIHRRCASALMAALAKVWEQFNSQEAIEAIGMHRFSGSYNYRAIRGSSRLSCHAFGAAVDFDADHNKLGELHGAMDPAVVSAFKSVGFFWGGDYHGRKDPMHFQGAHE